MNASVRFIATLLSWCELRPLVCAGLLAFSANVFAQDTNFWIFLCFGQSNMEGFRELKSRTTAAWTIDFKCSPRWISQSRTGRRANGTARINRCESAVWTRSERCGWLEPSFFCPISEGLAKQLFGFGELVLAVAARRSGDGTFGDYGRAVFASRS